MIDFLICLLEIIRELLGRAPKFRDMDLVLVTRQKILKDHKEVEDYYFLME